MAISSTDPRLLLVKFLQGKALLPEITVVEVGARVVPSTQSSYAEIFHAVPGAKVLAFEADPDACGALEDIADGLPANIKILPYALADRSGQRKLHITRNPMCSSLYEPNEKMLGLFEGLEVAEYSHGIHLNVDTLDEVLSRYGINEIDFIKIDVQGAEFDVFKGASDVLPSVLGVCTEVEFVSLYKQQPLFADVDAQLRAVGQQLHHFMGFGTRPIKQMQLRGVQQQLWSDAVYFAEPARLVRLSPERVLKLAVLASLYLALDLAELCLAIYDESCGTNLRMEFIEEVKLAKGCTDSKPQGKSAEEEIEFLPLADGNLVATFRSARLMTPYILREQGDWFEDELAFVRTLVRPGARVLDVGANHGVYALAMARRAGSEGRVWAFEPANQTAALLRHSVERNGLSNLQILQYGLSNHEGTASFFTSANSELNSLQKPRGAPVAEEQVRLTTLDACDAEHGFTEVSFVKMDAEGEELRILEGARNFFKRESPLVMFEYRHGQGVNTGLIEAFMAEGYMPYRLLPGAQVLVPFDPQEKPDRFLLNLFCCKRDKARSLEDAGLLRAGRPLLAEATSGSWQSLMRVTAYGHQILPKWVSSMPERPGQDVYLSALDEYAVAKETSGVEKASRLERALELTAQAIELHGDLSRLFTLARLSREAGLREVSLRALELIVQMLQSNTMLDVDEPFLVPDQRYEDIVPGDRIGAWCTAATLEAKEKTRAWSSYFTGVTALSDIETIERLGFLGPELSRRRNLILSRQAHN